jgi:flagellar hook-length control protein FliK
VGASGEGGQNHSEALSTSKTMIDFMASRGQGPLGAAGDSGAYTASQYSATSGSGYQAKVSELKTDRYGSAGSGAPMASVAEQKVLIDGAPQKAPAYVSQTSFSRDYLTENLSKLLGQRILANVKSGNYRLNFNIFPRELGMLDVTLELRDGRLEAQINATNVAARDLLNDSASRLRDALQASGFNNPSVDVTSDQGRREKRDGDANGQAGENVSGMTAQHDADNLLVVEDLYLDPNSVDMWV